MNEENIKIKTGESVLSDAESRARLEDVIKQINANKCLAFIGAGLSITVNYRNWEDVILGTKEGKSARKLNGLIHNVFGKSAKETDFAPKSLPDIAECCKIKDTNKYSEFILQEFGRGSSPSKFHRNHSRIWKIPFLSVVTTNYDSCLYDSAIEEETVKSYV
jgi:hypothetical protein